MSLELELCARFVLVSVACLPERDLLRRSLQVLFAHLEADELKDVIDAMFPVNPAKGEDVITQGDQGDNFYIIKAGTCLVLIDGAQVGEIPAGGSFGELALMYGTPRAATIQAKTACELFGIDRDTYCRILMGSTMRKRAAYETFLANVPLLKDLDKFERLTIADALTPTTYGAGDVIIKQGDVGDEFFMIQSGSCSVTQEVAGKSGEVAQLGEGDFFGEIALLTGDKRKATVTATSDVKTVKLDRDRFERVLGPCKAILQRDMANYKSFGGI